MNHRPPSGFPTPTASAGDAFHQDGPAGYEHGYDPASYSEDHTAYYGYGTGSYETGGYAASGYEPGGYPTATAQWDTGVQPDVGYSAYDPSHWSYDTSGAGIPRQPGPPESPDYGYPSVSTPTAEWNTTGQWSIPSWELAGEYDSATGWDTGQYDTGQYDTGGYAATAEYNSAAAPSAVETTAAWDFSALDEYAGGRDSAPEAYEAGSDAAAPGAHQDPGPAADAPEPDTGRSGTGRSSTAKSGTALGKAVAIPFPRTDRPSRRCPKRSALLTVAVPSLAVVGVAGVAAATVTGGGGSSDAKETQAAAPDPASVQDSEANSQLDTQVQGLTEDADDFADRASRTQERIDLQERQEAEKKRKAEEAARREAARPKFAVPVEDRGLSAYYGQAGVNWMSVHTGIDFPVEYGTPVMAATDGTITAKYDYSYGNMAVVTAPDGTETWYAHLDSVRIRSGSVQAGDTIAYSGNSGNSTGPHLHFEVHDAGGGAIDPLGWLQAQGLDPQ